MPEPSRPRAEPDPCVTLTVRSDPRYLCVARGVVRTFGLLVGFDEARAHAIALAVDEACSNIIRHAYRGRLDGAIEVCLRVRRRAGGGRRLVVRLLDRARRVPLESVARPAVVAGLKPGRLGLHLMYEVMDSIRLRPARPTGNLLEMTVKCPPTAGLARPARRPAR